MLSVGFIDIVVIADGLGDGTYCALGCIFGPLGFSTIFGTMVALTPPLCVFLSRGKPIVLYTYLVV